MTRITISLAALAAFAAAAPAAAQYGAQYDSQYGGYGQYGGYASGDVDIQGLQAEIDAGVSRGDISSQEASSLRSQLRGLVNLQRQYARNGLSGSERNDLQQRAQGLRNEIAQAGGYASGYGRGDDRYGRSGDYRTNRYGNNGYGTNGYGTNGYGTNGYGTNGYGNNGYGRAPSNGGAYGNGYGSGTYNQGYANRGYGSSGQYDRDQATRDDGRYGRGDNGDDGYGDDAYGADGGVALRVGDRAPGGLYGVPDEYRARFRDGPSFYYRYGAGNVYQIDARNGIVTRVIRIDR